jgi:hypothetical protein
MRERKTGLAFLCLALALIGGGCASHSTYAPTLSYRDLPNEGTESTVEIGAPLVYKAKVSEFDGITLLDPVTASALVMRCLK